MEMPGHSGIQMRFDGMPEILIHHGMNVLMGLPQRGVDYYSAMMMNAYVSSSAQMAIAMLLLRISETLEKQGRPTPQIGFRFPRAGY